MTSAQPTTPHRTTPSGGGGLARLKAEVRDFLDEEPGRRFRAQYERQKQRPLAIRLVAPLLAVVFLAIGVVLAFIPGPAFVFFGLAAAMLATQSLAIAKLIDRAELRGRRLRNRFKAWRARRRLRAA